MSIKIQRELMSIKGTKQLLNPHDVVKWAKNNKKSALHKKFQWNVSKAAYQHWLETARKLISVHITYATGERSFVSLSIDRVPGGGYRNIDDVVPINSLFEVMYRDAVKELERVRVRFERVRALKPVWDAIDVARSKSQKMKKAA